MTIDIDDLIKRMRSACVAFDRPTVNCKDLSALCRAIEGVLPALDRLQGHLEAGASIQHQDDLYCLFDSRGEGIVSGVTLRSMLINLIFVDC